MTLPNTDWQALSARVDRLEKQNQRLRYLLLVIAGCGLAGWWTTGGGQGPEVRATAAEAKGKTVTAEQLVLTDGQGRPRIRLATASQGPSCRLLDEAGHTRGEFGLNHDGPFSRFYDEKGHARIDLSLRPEGSFLMLHDEGGRLRVALGLRKEGSFLRLDDEEGRSRVGLLIGHDSNFSVSDSGGRPMLSRRF